MGGLYHFMREQHVLALVEEATERKITTVNLSHFEITDLPLLLFNLKHVKRLYLNKNKIQDISGISNLKKLRFLALDYNHLKALPEEIKQLSSHLTCLNISYNPLHKIIPGVGELRALTVLWLNHTQLTELPPELGNLSMLDTFGARGNFLQSIPNEFCKLSFLRWLTLEGNHIEELPKDFKNLESLVHLNMNRNNFTAVPECIQYLSGKLYQLIKPISKDYGPHTISIAQDLQYCFFAKNKIKEISKELLKAVMHLKKLDLHGNEGFHVTPEMKNFRNLMINDSDLRSQLPAMATAILDPALENEIEEISDDETEDSSDEEWQSDDSDEDEHDWEESLPSSELDLSEMSESEIGYDLDNPNVGIMIPESIEKMINSISCYVANG